MQSISTTHPLQLLKELEQTCKRRNAETVNNSKESNHWHGLGFRLGDQKLCINSKYISEILDSHFQQNLSKVPGAKKWLCGLISLRGQALPVIDLNQYFFNDSTKLSQKTRLLVIKLNEGKTGLIIDEAFGLKAIDLNSECMLPQSISPELKRFSNNAYHHDDKVWIELSIQTLGNDPNFLNAARF